MTLPGVWNSYAGCLVEFATVRAGLPSTDQWCVNVLQTGSVESLPGHRPGYVMRTDSNPFRALEEQFEHMRRQFEELVDRWNGQDFGEAWEMRSTTGMGIDLADREDQFVLTADVSGFDREDIDVRLADRTIHVTAEREREERDDEEQYLRSERTHRTIRRSVRLPVEVDEDAVEATCRNGVLTVTLPKTEPTDLDGDVTAVHQESMSRTLRDGARRPRRRRHRRNRREPPGKFMRRPDRWARSRPSTRRLYRWTSTPSGRASRRRSTSKCSRSSRCLLDRVDDVDARRRAEMSCPRLDHLQGRFEVADPA